MTWEAETDYLKNGQYIVKLVFTKTNTYDDILFTFTSSTGATKQALLKSLEKVDAPDVIRVTPGPCDKTYPDIVHVSTGQGSSLNSSIAGHKEQVTIQCRDKYNNMIHKGGDYFTSSIVGVDLAFVKTDFVQSTIRDNSDGTYTLEFVVAYQGLYKLEVSLNHLMYGQAIPFTAKNSFCNDAPNTVRCPGTDECVPSIKNCSIGLLSGECPDERPFWCAVDGIMNCTA